MPLAETHTTKLEFEGEVGIITKRWIGVLSVVLAAGLALGCLTAVAAGQSTRALVVGVAAPPNTMNPHGTDADSNLSVMANIFEGLLQRDTAGELKPALATAWERVDALTWRFRLRQDVRFHNGNPFTWEDVQFSLERIRNPEVSEFLNFGAMVESVTPIGGDPWFIEIKTTHPVPFFDQNLHQIFIMDKESTETRTPGEVSQVPIGTGPYRFVEWVRGSYLKLTAYDGYWGGQPPIRDVELRPITEASTRIAAILSGQVDVLQDVPVTFIDRIASDPRVELITRPARRSIWLGLNNRPGSPTADLRVRQAMAMAINVEEIIEKVMFGHATPAAQIPDPPTVGYDAGIERLPYDPQRARELLAEAGFPEGFAITLTGPNDRYVQDEQILAAVAAQLAQVGIEVKVDAKPLAIYFPEVDEHHLDFNLLGWFDGSYDFARSYSQLLHTVDVAAGHGATNGTSYSNPELDAIYAESTQIVDTARRAEVLRELNRRAMEQVAVIPLHYQEDTYAVFRGSGVQFTPRSDTWLVFNEIAYLEP